ncbi:MAG: 2-polyprenyl-3-methyl-6-methoxy-1,4-benzoquinone monooxygenase [Thiotrichales bacterium]|nr:2-polyprenyl-3-methyl-6-methoxy-1,4-benzoquinone monooxygenase [Thiotrichales bacterium]
MYSQRQYSRLDHFLSDIQNLLSKDASSAPTLRANPATKIEDKALDASEKKLSAALMRVNHAGEVAAQGLYLGQALSAKSSDAKQQMRQAAAEEGDHLHWCEQRLDELDSRASHLNPIWYAGSVVIGILAGQSGDHWSYGFIEETEHQVMKHLEEHLNELPEKDKKSRAILQQMQHDEGEHAAAAKASGAEDLPTPIKKLMGLSAKLMTISARYI